MGTVVAYGDLIAMVLLTLALGGVVVAMRALLRRSSRPAPPPSRPRKPPAPLKPAILVDGSNVLFWDNETPDLGSVRAVVRLLEAKGFRAGVMFDASAGYKIGKRYLDDADLAGQLGLALNQVLVVPKGTIADEYLLKAARGLKARIVTNDKYRDWAKQFPEVRKPGHLVPGQVINGKARLTL